MKTSTSQQPSGPSSSAISSLEPAPPEWAEPDLQDDHDQAIAAVTLSIGLVLFAWPLWAYFHHGYAVLGLLGMSLAYFRGMQLSPSVRQLRLEGYIPWYTLLGRWTSRVVAFLALLMCALLAATSPWPLPVTFVPLLFLSHEVGRCRFN